MSLIQKINKLKKLNEGLILKAEKRSDGNYAIRDWMQVSNTLNELKDFSFLNNIIEDIFATDEVVSLRVNEWIALQRVYESLKIRIEFLSKTIDSCIELITENLNDYVEIPENKGLLKTRMPDIIDMKKMSKICDDLDKVFNQCPLIKEEVKFTGVEKGSIFFIFIASTISLTMVGKLLSVALDVQKKYHINQMMIEKLRTMKNAGDLNEGLIKELQDEVTNFSREKANEIEEAGNFDNEEMNRLTLTISTLSSLLGQGVQMQCMLSENQEGTEISFPSTEEFKILADSIKMLN